MSLPLQKGRLGRGLASLIGEAPRVDAALPAHGEQRLLPISELHPSGLNPRKDFDHIEMVELAQSIRAKGLVQPIIARPDRQRGGYEIVAGERRWRAAQKAPLHTVPVIVRELSDQDVAEFAVIENVQRKDLNPIEEATGYSELITRFRYTQEEVAELVGKSRSHLANTLRLLKLPPEVQTLLREGKITAGHARALIGREDAAEMAERIVANDLTVRDVETVVNGPAGIAARIEEVAAIGAGGDGNSGPPQMRDPQSKDADTVAFEKDLSDALGLSVEVKRGSGESGSLSIRYSNYEQLDYVRNRLLGMYG
jgi:ParB family transcriptional regulator, chromosome partitioning protein